ncbi:lamin tail domain-containing protein [Candidatus Beckwithbacteria bacterium]|nr:lamin tail domain-containing protein [Candidatus Beckwithbacteria bacterium]
MSTLLRSIVFLVVLFFLISFPRFVWAIPNINSYPQQIEINQESSLSFTGDLDSNSEYYYKIRIGVDNTLNKAETFNPQSNKWLGDNSSWVSFPVLITTETGQINPEQSAIFRVKDTAELGKNNLVIRVQKVETTNNIDSDEKEIKIIVSETTSTSELSPTSTPTPTSETKTYQNYDNIKITEVFPSPETGAEWVEFYNGNDNSVNLEGWYLKDRNALESNKDGEIIADLEIASKSYKAYEVNDIALNNSGDLLKLFNAALEEKFSLEYPEISKGISWALVNDNWCLAEPSQNSANSSCIEEESDEEEDESENPTPTPSPQVLGTKTTTPKSTIKNSTNSAEAKRKLPELLSTSSATPISSVLGEQVSSRSGTKKPLLPFGIAGLGLAMIGGASVPVMKPKLNKFLQKVKKN